MTQNNEQAGGAGQNSPETPPEAAKTPVTESRPEAQPQQPYPQPQQGMNAWPAYSPYYYPQYRAVPKKPKERRPASFAELILLPAALFIGIVFDRLANVAFTGKGFSLPFFMAVFWLVYIGVVYALKWKALRSRPELWYIAGCAAALCVWCFIFDYRSEYGMLTVLVVPGLLMAHAVLLLPGVDFKRIGFLAERYVLGWFYKPFSSLSRLFEIIGLFFGKMRGKKLYMTLLGVAVAIPLLAVVIPLLAGADVVFSRWLSDIFRNFSFPALIGHTILAATAAMLFFSFLHGSFLADDKIPPAKEHKKADPLFSAVALGVVLCVYLLFDGVQFVYLFAGAGLPDGMSYTEYAVNGFWQLIVVASINLTVFGVLLHYTPKNTVVRAELLALLGLTGVMLVSAFVRLSMYAERFGMTWLRLLSYWFMIFLAAVLVLCVVRMFMPKMPLVFISAMILAGWFVMFGFANPSRLFMQYNLNTFAANDGTWISRNAEYIVSEIPDDGLIAVLESEYLLPEDRVRLTSERDKQAREGLSIASGRARSLIESALR